MHLGAESNTPSRGRLPSEWALTICVPRLPTQPRRCSFRTIFASSPASSSVSGIASGALAGEKREMTTTVTNHRFIFWRLCLVFNGTVPHTDVCNAERYAQRVTATYPAGHCDSLHRVIVGTRVLPG